MSMTPAPPRSAQYRRGLLFGETLSSEETGSSNSTDSLFEEMPILGRVILEPVICEDDESVAEVFWQKRGRLAGFRGVPVSERGKGARQRPTTHLRAHSSEGRPESPVKPLTVCWAGMCLAG